MFFRHFLRIIDITISCFLSHYAMFCFGGIIHRFFQNPGKSHTLCKLKTLFPCRVYMIVVGIMVCFVASHWEKYNTGILFLPWGYDIGQIVSGDI